MSPSHMDFMSFAHLPSYPFLFSPPPSHLSFFAFCGCQTNTDKNQLGEGNGLIWLTAVHQQGNQGRKLKAGTKAKNKEEH